MREGRDWGGGRGECDEGGGVSEGKEDWGGGGVKCVVIG